MKSPVGWRQFHSGFAFLLILMLWVLPATAINVGGVIEGGVWTAADSPVQVEDNLILPAGATLEIEPGVRVEFLDAFEFRVHGLLLASGTAEDKIVFTTADPSPDTLTVNKRWKGIRFLDASRGCKLEHCRIEYGWARVSDFDPHDITISGDHAYIADGLSGLRIIDVSDPLNPVEIGFYDTPRWAFDVAVAGDYAYVADRESGLLIIDVSDPQNPQLTGSIDTPGYACGVTIDGQYAYVSDYMSGLRVIDISDPANPGEVSFIDTPGFAYSTTIYDNHAFVADHSGGLRIIDISDPANPTDVSVFEPLGQVYDVEVRDTVAYIADAYSTDANYSGGIHAIDIRDLANPVELSYAETRGHSYAVSLYGNRAYVGDREGGLVQIDIENPARIRRRTIIPFDGYVCGVGIQDSYAYIANWREHNGGMRIVNVLYPDSLLMAGSYDTPGSDIWNWPANNGGGVYLERSTVNINRCEFAYNRAESEGGAVYGWFTQSVLKNNLFVHNSAGSNGGGIFFAYSTPIIQNCTIANNYAGNWGGGLFVGADASPVIANSIFVFNSQESDVGDAYFGDLARAKSSESVVSFCCIRAEGDPFGGAGNIAANPQFINTSLTDFDYHLSYTSPCVDSGDPAMNSLQEENELINMGAYGGTEESTISVPVFFNNLISNPTGPLRLNFGSVRINSSSSEEITIVNNGHSRLYIEDILFSSPSLYPDSAEGDNGLVPAYSIAPIEPGEVLKFGLNFRPDEIRSYSETITFITNDTIATVEPPMLEMVGIGTDPVGSFSPDSSLKTYSLDFSRKQIGSVTELSTTIYNIGRDTLRLTSYSIQGDGYSLDLENTVIPPGRNTDATVTFEPDRPSRFEGIITIRNNDAPLTLNVDAVGTGPKMAVVIDSLRTLFLGYVYFNGDTSDYTLTILNEGDANLNLSGALVADPEVFSPVLPDGGLNVLPSDSAYLHMRFHPPQANLIYESSVILSGNYPVQDTILLVGRGMAEPGRYVFGEVSGTWETDPLNPVDYIVLDSVLVPAHETLKIRPGVRVLFEPGAKFKADGELRAVGSPGDSIYFMPRDLSGTPESRWNGIDVNFVDATRLSFCVISGSVNGLGISESSPLVQFCTITGNGLSDLPDIMGGGVFMENAGARINGCIIEGNTAWNGGGLYVLNSKPLITNTIIRNNRAAYGGSMFLRFKASAWIQNNLIYNNIADSACGGVAIYDLSNPYLINNTIVNNTGGGVISAIRSIPSIANTIIWNNNGSSIVTMQNANVLVSYSDIEVENPEETFRGKDNLNVEPGFADLSVDDFHLAADSPLIDAGNPEASHRDYFFPPSLGSAVNDIGAYGGPMGSGWESSEISIYVYQNSAFPRWLDIYVVSLETPEIAPTCTLSVDYVNPMQIALSPLNDGEGSYHGVYEVTESGTIFFTVDAVLSGGRNQKVSRTYEVAIVEPENGGVFSIAGVDATIKLRAGSFKNDLIVISGTGNELLQPEDDIIALSPVFFVDGLNGTLDTDAEIAFTFDFPVAANSFADRLAIYRIESERLEKVTSMYEGGKVYAQISRGGRFVLAIGDENNDTDRAELPFSKDLIRAYPNPFNQSVRIEFLLNTSADVNLKVYDLSGRVVADLVNEQFNAGSHQIVWNGLNASGQVLPSGIYWARFNGAGKNESVKLLLLR